MEFFLKCYFEYFNDLPRHSLHDRRKRREMVEYISTLIEGCTQGEECETQKSVAEAIRTIITFHGEKKNSNSTVCLMGKYHNILYVALRLCYVWQLKDTETVVSLLKNIYECEGTFERLFIGAIFGNKAPHYIAGWKSDFDSQEENVRAIVYFIDQASKGALHLDVEGEDITRFIDVPIESCGKATALKISVQLGLPDKLIILLRFGALPVRNQEETTVFEHISNRLLEFNHVYPYNLVACLQLLLRASPTMQLRKIEDEMLREGVMQRYSDLVEDGLIPLTRCGINAPELKHLCRCCIRKQLWLNFQLPDGIRTLPIPDKLHRYIDILED